MNNDAGVPFSSQPLNTAVLFVIFNRLDTTKQVLEAIRQAKPVKLYIVSDGARKEKQGEQEIVSSIREYVLSNIDWECEVKINFRTDNAGCGLSMKSSIDWFFSHEECGIVLEDDVVPNQSFFKYCEDLLVRYKDDNRIGMISGNNHIGDNTFDDSYTFSKYKGCWGWATWRRAWENMDFEMNWLRTNSKDLIIKNMGYSQVSKWYWQDAIKLISANQVSAWDWQWYFSLAAQNQLCIFPKNNLVSNIGFGIDATHTTGNANKRYIETKNIEFPLSHPRYIVVNYKHDKEFEKIKIKSNLWKKFVPKWLKQKIKNMTQKKAVYEK